MNKIIIFVSILIFLTSCFFNKENTENLDLNNTWTVSTWWTIWNKIENNKQETNTANLGVKDQKIIDQELKAIKEKEEQELNLIKAQADEKWKIAEKENEEFMKKYQR